MFSAVKNLFNIGKTSYEERSFTTNLTVELVDIEVFCCDELVH